MKRNEQLFYQVFQGFPFPTLQTPLLSHSSWHLFSLVDFPFIFSCEFRPFAWVVSPKFLLLLPSTSPFPPVSTTTKGQPLLPLCGLCFFHDHFPPSGTWVFLTFSYWHFGFLTQSCFEKIVLLGFSFLKIKKSSFWYRNCFAKNFQTFFIPGLLMLFLFGFSSLFPSSPYLSPNHFFCFQIFCFLLKKEKYSFSLKRLVSLFFQKKKVKKKKKKKMTPLVCRFPRKLGLFYRFVVVWFFPIFYRFAFLFFSCFCPFVSLCLPAVLGGFPIFTHLFCHRLQLVLFF